MIELIVDDMPMPVDRPTPKNALAIWVIYERPKDYPDFYVLRCTWTLSGGEIKKDEIGWLAPTPDELRKILPPGLTRVPRFADDDPVILETWM